MRRVCVAGGRDFVDYSVVKRVLDSLLATGTELVIIMSGGAHGADSLGERYAREHGLPFEIYPADWRKDWKRAGFIRNAQMAGIADELIAFWDGKSHGTAHMIKEMLSRGKPVNVFDYKGKRFHFE